MNLQDLDYRNILYSPIFSKILVTVIIIVIGLIIGRIVSKITYRILHEFGLNKIIRKTTKIKISLENIISNFIAYFIYLVTIILALPQLGLTTTVLNIVISAIAIIVIITLFFIIKYFFPNVIAGIFIQKRNLIKEGDHIKIDDKNGEIIRINMIETVIKTKNGNIIYIPNSILAKKEITKLSK